MYKHKFVLVASARWEEDAILEWLDYHRAIGFDHIYLYANEDDPEPLMRAAAPHLEGDNPFVTFHHWPQTLGKQASAFHHFICNYRNECGWVGFLDIDEFIALRGVNDIGRFMAPLEDICDCVYFNWFVYGSNGRKERAHGSVLIGLNRRNACPDPHTKNLIRASFLDPASILAAIDRGAMAYFHFWDDYKFDGYRIVDALGEPLVGYNQDWPTHARALVARPGWGARIASTAYVAHFQFKSEADFMRRVARGQNALVPDSGGFWKDFYESGEFRAHLEANDGVEDNYLRNFWALKERQIAMARAAKARAAAEESRVACETP